MPILEPRHSAHRDAAGRPQDGAGVRDALGQDVVVAPARNLLVDDHGASRTVGHGENELGVVRVEEGTGTGEEQ